jgi:hypothetical protein
MPTSPAAALLVREVGILPLLSFAVFREISSLVSSYKSAIQRKRSLKLVSSCNRDIRHRYLIRAYLYPRLALLQFTRQHSLCTKSLLMTQN